ncbi:MAG: hypothetical protein DSZ03_03680 [Sulfurimonas sp.]|nr:MAG: hypothetical protein DSZ03_03680 [Sulfurimonas sp.]
MKVAVSACLWGEVCRYDGASQENLHVKKRFEGCEVVLFCPEAPVLGTPRERISVIAEDAVLRVVGDDSGRDVTVLLQAQTQQFIETHRDLDAIILKSKSPSCGIGTTPILNADKICVRYGNGVAAEMLLAHYTKIDIIDETAV